MSRRPFKKGDRVLDVYDDPHHPRIGPARRGTVVADEEIKIGVDGDPYGMVEVQIDGDDEMENFNSIYLRLLGPKENK